MTTERTVLGRVEEDSVACWCCGAVQPESSVLRLGNHPEVAVCVRCARWLAKRAAEVVDRTRHTPAARVRDGFRSVRTAVVRRGWHQLPVAGPLVRWIGSHTP